MSPLDDELRQALSGRASRVQPAGDPLAGIERRARGLRRNRLLSGAAAVVLLAGGAAVGVPALLGATGTEAGTEVIVPASSAPGPSPVLPSPVEPSPTVSTAAPTPSTPAPSSPSLPAGAVLDPAAPWAYQGTESVRTGFAPQVQSAWASRHPGSTITPLFGRVFESSRQPELVFVATGPGGSRWGFAKRSSSLLSGPPPIAFVEDRPLPARATALVLTMGAEGGEGSTLLVVAAPGSGGVFYSGQGTADQTQMLAPVEGLTGVGIQFRGGDPARDRVRVQAADGTTVYDQRIGGAGPAATPTSARPRTPPTNVLSWPRRGRAVPVPQAALTAFARGLGGTAADLTFRPLLVLDFDGGLQLWAGQAWLAGGEAHAVSYAVGGSCPASTFLGPKTPASTKVLAFALDCVPGRTTETVLVVPQPQTGQVSYGAQGSEYRPVDFLPGLEPVAELERDAAARRGVDRLQVLDGNGDRDRPLYEGPLDALLCGLKECG